MDEMIQTPTPTPEIPPGEFDNQWVKFMAQLSQNESMKDMIDYINAVHWSRRQRKTIMSYCRILMGNRFATTNFTDQRDYRMLFDDKSLIDCDLTVGLTRFDLTPEWNILLGMITIHFGASARMSKAGWFVKKIGTHRHEIDHEERTRDRTQGFREKAEQALYGD